MAIDCLLHVHSSFSYDSKSDLADIARIARANGIQCVMMSEHNNFMDAPQVSALVARCTELSTDDLLIVPGLELAFDNNRVHLLAFGVRRYIDSTAPGTTFRSLIDAVREAHGIAVLAHPSHRDAASRLAFEDLRELDGIEVWNVKNGNRFVPEAGDIELLRKVRSTAARKVFAFAGLDWHHLDKFSFIALRVDTDTLTQEAIFRALNAGTYTIRGGFISLPSTGIVSPWRGVVYKAGADGLKASRRAGYRWQSKLERSGFKTPKFVAALAKRLF